MMDKRKIVFGLKTVVVFPLWYAGFLPASYFYHYLLYDLSMRKDESMILQNPFFLIGVDSDPFLDSQTSDNLVDSGLVMVLFTFW